MQKEVRWALEADKKVVLVYESVPRHGGMSFDEHKYQCIKAFPKIEHVFSDAVAIEYQRIGDLRDGMLKLIMKRANLLASSAKLDNDKGKKMDEVHPIDVPNAVTPVVPSILDEVE